MDFFEHQDVARRKSGRLVFLFGLAVVLIIALVYVAIATILVFAFGEDLDVGGLHSASIWQPKLLLMVAGATVAVVAAGSLYKTGQLRSGGHVVAESLGGRLMDPSSRDRLERKILNVVEEMAIASGTPVPPAYLLESEAGINAFAAGYSSHDAVIGVTRGCAELLDRDELQGVIAHEFSHVINGDMRINIRLIGVIHGILVIGLLGNTLLRSAFYGGATRTRRRNSNSTLPVVIGIGLALTLIGYLGRFFGQLIKAAVSRQREFLADAAAVQFTRYPGGIAGALKKIGGHSFRAKIHSPRAEEASHLFFGEATEHWLGLFMATHPSLPLRIQRIEPGWDGVFPETQTTAPKKTKSRFALRRPSSAAADTVSGFSGVDSVSQARTTSSPAAFAASAINQIGRPTDAHIGYAAELVNALPDPVKDAARESFGARAIVYALICSNQSRIRADQLRRLKRYADPQVFGATKKLAPLVDRIEPAARLPLIDMTLSSLCRLSDDQLHAFKSNMEHLIRADDEVDLFEWTLRRIVLQHLEPLRANLRRVRIRYYSVKPVARECSLLLSTLSYVGHGEPEQAQRAFTAGANHLEEDSVTHQPAEKCTLAGLGRALGTLAAVGPRQKGRILNACTACIIADRAVTVREGELLRAIATTLDCPIPPLLPGQPLADG